MLITRISALSGKTNTLDIPVSEEQLQNWHNGVLIQNAVPHLTPDDREFLMTGITPQEWKDTFGKEE